MTEQKENCKLKKRNTSFALNGQIIEESFIEITAPTLSEAYTYYQKITTKKEAKK